MFFILSKLSAFAANPLFWIFIILIFALFAGNSVKRKRRLFTAVILLFIFSNSAIYRYSNLIITEKPIPVSELDASYDFGIVLGGIASFDSISNRIVFGETADRLNQAVYLYHKQIIKKILISGGSGYLFDKQQIEAVFLSDYLKNTGIPAKDIIIEKKSKNTYQNAQNTAKLLAELNFKNKALLITSATHMLRAKKCFEKAGISVDIFPVNYNLSYKQSFDDYLIPKADILNKWEQLLHEIIGLLTYKLTGYI